MKAITDKIRNAVREAVLEKRQVDLPAVECQPTKKEFEGEVTVVIFPMLRHAKARPEELGVEIGTYLQERLEEVSGFNVVKGFLNLSLSDRFYLDALADMASASDYGKAPASGEAVIVEYSSPNTNKPLHLGHIRNNLLGYSVSEILKAAGKKVYKTQIINDRGIHICKSMYAWKVSGKGETPENTGRKGDHLVGSYYVLFNQLYSGEVEQMVREGMDREEAEKKAPSLLASQEMLRKWEAGDPETVELWKTMNGWVYKGFDETYRRLGVDFDFLLYESDTYLLGKDQIQEGLEKGVFYRREDGSVWIDLTDDGLDEKIVLRADGTAVYMTQDIGTAIQRVERYPDVTGMVYTVGNEQEYHFKVLFLILEKLGYQWADQLYHLSYGMVELPSGKMKSREGTVVDADDLMAEMKDTAREISSELGKLEGYTEEQKDNLYEIIGLGALKYFILKVDPRKQMVFNPEESVDFQGNTGPFVQYTHARIQSILRKYGGEPDAGSLDRELTLNEKEREMLVQLLQFPQVVQWAAEQYSPALVANYAYELVRTFNSYYQQVTILGEPDEGIRKLRVLLSAQVARVIRSAFLLLGIEVPDRM